MTGKYVGEKSGERCWEMLCIKIIHIDNVKVHVHKIHIIHNCLSLIHTCD